MFNFDLQGMLLAIPGIIIGLSFHEFAHAFASDRLGDPTPANQGRLTLSPLAHIDVIGFIMILIVHFGWGKPVQINPSYYRHPKRDELIVSLAGPFMNLVIAFVFVLIYRLVFNLYTGQNALMENTLNVIGYVTWINIILFFFNLIPLPPLDGFTILRMFIPRRRYRVVWFLERYSIILLIIIVLPIISQTPIISYVIQPLARFLESLMYSIVGLT